VAWAGTTNELRASAGGGRRYFRPPPAGMPVLGQPDDPVVESPAAVDDARGAWGCVVGEVEVVPDQFHLLKGLVDGHGLGGVRLLPHDASGQVVVEVPALFGDLGSTFVGRLLGRQ